MSRLKREKHYEVINTTPQTSMKTNKQPQGGVRVIKNSLSKGGVAKER